VLLSAPALAHHGIGRFDPRGYIELEGTLTGLDFVNPHSYVHFDVVGDDGAVISMSCEMRAAAVLRRSGWSPDMFTPGVSIVITGRPHRDDPASCYADTLKIGEQPTLQRYQQLGDAEPVERALRLPTGEPNITGDWAEEQYLIAQPPDGGPAGLVPKSQLAAIEAGELPMPPAPASWFPPPVTLTEAGRAAEESLRNAPPSENPRLSCGITSILFDWVFDGPVNRITQTPAVITLEYGHGLTRHIYMNLDEHPAAITPSRAGHSIGRWEGDTLVVHTVGFLPGSLAGTVPHSGELVIVERFTLDPESFALHRDYVAEDPVYFTGQYVSSDTVLPADAPFAVDDCKELAFEYRAPDQN
jgi:hypothetical protein